MNILAIDTGSMGGMALIDSEGEPIAVLALPGSKTKTYWNTLIGFIEKAKERGDFEAVVERVWGMAGQAGAGTIAVNFGIVVGVLRANKIEPIEVVPQVWQRAFIPAREKDDRGRGLLRKMETPTQRKARLNADREERKRALIDHAALVYQRKVDHSGIADALLIGRWRWLVRQGVIEPPKAKPKRRRKRRKGKNGQAA